MKPFSFIEQKSCNYNFRLITFKIQYSSENWKEESSEKKLFISSFFCMQLLAARYELNFDNI